MGLHVVHILPLIVVCTVLFLILNLNLKSFHVIEKEDLNFTLKTLEENNLNIQRTLDALDENNLNLQNVGVLSISVPDAFVECNLILQSIGVLKTPKYKNKNYFSALSLQNKKKRK